MENEQRNIVKVVAIFNRKFKKGWVEEHRREEYMLNPKMEDVKELAAYMLKEFHHRISYHMRGEIDRVIHLYAHYPTRLSDGRLAYYGRKIFYYDFEKGCWVDGELSEVDSEKKD
jgi:hypothetical protein